MMIRSPNTAHGRGRPIPLPAWVPAEGTFANVGLNTLYDARPPGWPTNDSASPFLNWCGAVFAPEFGTMGGWVINGSGHLSAGTPLWAGVWIWDVATREWVGRNIPGAPMLESSSFFTDFNAYYESLTPGIEGHPYPAHTYDGLVYQSPAEGGGTSGSLLRVCIGGGSGSGNRCVHQFDLSSLTAVPTRVIDTLSNVASTGYPMVAKDAARGGFWVTSYLGMNSLTFVSFSGWTQTNYPSVAFNGPTNCNMIYVPDRDCLVAMGGTAGAADMTVRVCPIVGGVPQGWTVVTQSGTKPADSRCGGDWSTLLGKIVSYEARLSYNVHKLTVPADLTGGTWVWETETLTGAGGATPSGYASNNGAWSRFREVPEARCFVWCDSMSHAVQAFRLTGM